MVATGIDIHGNEVGIKVTNDNEVICDDMQLASLTVPNGVVYVRIWGNKKIHLSPLPASVNYLLANKEVPNLERYIGSKINVYLD